MHGYIIPRAKCSIQCRGRLHPVLRKLERSHAGIAHRPVFEMLCRHLHLDVLRYAGNGEASLGHKHGRIALGNSCPR